MFIYPPQSRRPKTSTFQEDKNGDDHDMTLVVMMIGVSLEDIWIITLIMCCLIVTNIASHLDAVEKYNQQMSNQICINKNDLRMISSENIDF